MRRSLIDQTGASKGELARGEHKSIHTDRVMLVPGPAEEIEIVRWIYRSFVSEKKTEREIADALNERGLPIDLGRPWTRGMVHQILINEKYIGNNVWNRSSFKLKRKRVYNLPNTWIRADGAFEAIVDRTTFDAAQAIIQARSLRLSDEETLKVASSRLASKIGSLEAAARDSAARPQIIPLTSASGSPSND